MRLSRNIVVALFFVLSLSVGTARAQAPSTQLDVPVANGLQLVSPPTAHLDLETPQRRLSNAFQFVSPPTGNLRLERPQHRSSRRLERGLLMGGGFGFLASYLVNAGVGGLAGVSVGWGWYGSGGGSDQRWDDFRLAGLIPVVGPWIQLALQPTGFADDDWGPFLITTGLLQAASLGLFIAGLVVGAEDGEPADVQVSPWADRDGAGLTVSGVF